MAGRILGEAYVGCAEAQAPLDETDEALPADAIGLARLGTAGVPVDVRYHYDAYPGWAGTFSSTPDPATAHLAGRLAATSDPAQRSLTAYDARGAPDWTARQVVWLRDPHTLGAIGDPPALVTESGPAVVPRAYDETTEYVQTFLYDHAGRVVRTTLPTDPDWDDAPPSAAPVVEGTMVFNRRGLPAQADLVIDSASTPVTAFTYDEHRLPSEQTHGAATPGAYPRTELVYDSRLRLAEAVARRVPDGMASGSGDLADVSVVFHQMYAWDAANNLTGVWDLRIASEWPAGHKPRNVEIRHDALYRVERAELSYETATGHDTATDWRTERMAHPSGTSHQNADPMREEPAPMVPTLPADRVANLNWTYDWLANMSEWTDDARRRERVERAVGHERAGATGRGRRTDLMSTRHPTAYSP